LIAAKRDLSGRQVPKQAADWGVNAIGGGTGTVESASLRITVIGT